MNIISEELTKLTNQLLVHISHFVISEPSAKETTRVHTHAYVHSVIHTVSLQHSYT